MSHKTRLSQFIRLVIIASSPTCYKSLNDNPGKNQEIQLISYLWFFLFSLTKARLPVKWMPPESLFLGESSAMSDVYVTFCALTSWHDLSLLIKLFPQLLFNVVMYKEKRNSKQSKTQPRALLSIYAGHMIQWICKHVVTRSQQ